MKTEIELYRLAREAMEHAYAPYSGYCVGAALETAGGEVYQGANMENASYGASICAERVAVCKAMYDGHKDFRAIAVCASGDDPAWPCGICRQFIFEFGSSTLIITGPDEEHLETATIGELLPRGFRLEVTK